MNKTININLGGMFFHIDETAYQKLKKYLNAIRKSLSDDPQGQDEIIKDIELRISELLSSKIVDERQVVSDSDIDEIIDVMGQPEDYNVDEELFNESTSTSYTSRKSKPSKKLYRDMDDKFFGGVCSGTAHYVGIEPIWSRIIWLIVAFGTGFGFLIYILLWILLPKAETTAEKLEMEGEKVNIDNIERKIREEFNAVSDKVRDGASEIKDNFKKKSSSKSKSGLQEFLDTIGSILMTLLKIFAKFIGVLIIIVSAVVLLGLIISLFSIGSLEFLGFGDEFIRYPSQFANTYFPYWLIMLLFFFAVAIPIVVLFMLGLKILSNNTKSFGKVTSLTLLALWILSILGLIFSGLDVASKYRHKGIDTTTHDIELVANDTLKIVMKNDIESYDVRKHRRHNNLKTIYVNGQEKLYSNDIAFDIRKSNYDYAYLIVRKISRGSNYENANENAEKIEYKFKVENSTLKLDNYFLDYSDRFPVDQEVDVILYLPEGVKIYLDKSTKYHLDDVANKQDIYDTKMINHYYIMEENELNCTDCVDENTTQEVKTTVE